MSVELDHILIPARDKLAAARLIASFFDVPWSETGIGPFAPVFLNDGLTLDFDQWDAPLPQIHYCFRVDAITFDTVLARIRAAGIDYRSSVHGPIDRRVDTAHGGKIIYWNEPDGHMWEMLTVSYARKPGEG